MSKLQIYAYGDGGVSEDVRIVYPLSHMKKDDDFDFAMQIGSIHPGSKIPADNKAIYVFSRPMKNLDLAIHEIKELGAPVIVDVDDNFWKIPKTHIGYDVVGPESINTKALTSILHGIRYVTVSTKPLADFLIEKNIVQCQPIIIPNVCNSHNQYNRLKRPSKYVRFGFSGTMTHREDFRLILKPLTQFIKEEEMAKVVIGVDPEIYKMLRDVPENKKMFVPTVDYANYPIQLSYFDVMLIPLVDDSFNQSKSDIKVLDAIINGKPFIASKVEPYLPYIDSGAGFVLPNTETEWYTALKKMMLPELREAQVKAGIELSKKHHVDKSSQTWKKLIIKVAKERK